jgi:hypothetical protein
MRNALMPRLALYTFGISKAPTGSESMADFVAMTPSVFAEAEATEGFFGHATAVRPDLAGKSKVGEDFGPWGIAVAPRFYDSFSKPGAETMIATLSLWRDIEVVRQFAYGPLHAAALRRRSDWFHKPSWPGYVLWWAVDGQVPTWADGAHKLEVLADYGPTGAAFNFAKCFDSAGAPV